MTGPISHRAFGYSIVANRRIDGLPLGSAVGAREISVCLQDVPESIRALADTAGDPFYVSPFLGPDGGPALRAWTREEGGFFVLQHGDGSICVVDRPADRLWMTWPAHVSDPEEFLLGTGLAFALRLRGNLCIHASALVIGSRAVMLAGPSASGKSTLAAVLAADGHPVIADDVSVVQRSADGWVVAPGPRRIRLRRGGGAVVTGAAHRDIARRDSPGGAFEDIWLDEAGVAQVTAAIAIDAIYFLDPSPSSAADETPGDMPRADALIALVSDSWAARWQDRDMRQREFEMASDLVATTRIRRIRFRMDESSVRSIADRIVGDTARTQDAA